MRTTISMAIICSLALLVSPLPGQTKRTPELNALMQEKLKCSQQLLEGMVVNDFNKVSQNAERLIQLSKTAEWMVHKTPRYELFSNEFRRAAETIAQKAQAKNIDGVALGYVDMTMTCVRCHQYVREIRDARLPAKGFDNARNGR